MAWYLDMPIDRREGGIEFLPGTHKWRIKCNWKFPVDNGYHGPVSHGSAWESGFEGMARSKKGYGYEGLQINAGGGLGFGSRWAENEKQVYEMALPEFLAYEKDRFPETHTRLGDLRGMHLRPTHWSILPNFSMLWQSGTMRVWHPRRVNETEGWSWCFVDAKADRITGIWCVSTTCNDTAHPEHGSRMTWITGCNPPSPAADMLAGSTPRTSRWVSTMRLTIPSQSILTCASASLAFRMRSTSGNFTRNRRG